MENLMIYFLKANGLLILFYLMYFIFLRKETFFTSNRWYLIGGLVLSLILPLITFTKTIWVEPTPIPELYEEAIPIVKNAIEVSIQENPLDWYLILITAYLVISTLIIMKIVIELVSFFNKIRKHQRHKDTDFTLIHSSTTENPFSFFHYVVINPNRFSTEEFHHILTHERIHVQQKHSIDVLLGKLFCAFFWVNPIIWFYRKAMLQNLEFIADNQTLQHIENKYQYQHTLLKVVTHQHNLSITNQFYQSLIKKRIVMLHTNQSHKKNVWKYATILPLLVGFMFLFQVKTVAQVKESKTEETSFAVTSSYSSILTKNTTDNELRALEKTFSDDKRTLKISKVKRNKNGEITEIKLSFDTGKTYNRVLERKSTEGIDAIKIFLNSDKDDNETCGFEEITAVAAEKFNATEENGKVQVTDDYPTSPTPPTPPTPPSHPCENLMNAPSPPDYPEVPDFPSNIDDKIIIKKYEMAMALYDKRMKAVEPKMREFEKKIEKYEQELKLREPSFKKYEDDMNIFEQKMIIFEKEMEIYLKDLEKFITTK